MASETVIRVADTLSKCSHTPGPWMVGNVGQREDPRMVYCDDSLGSRVADCSTSGHGLTVEQDLANARLIAAAPELLFALKALVAWQAEIKHAVPLSYLDGAKAAIAKAEGRS